MGFDNMNKKLSNDKVIPFPNLPLRLLDKGRNLLAEGHIKEAIPMLEEAELMDPDNPEILYTLIGAYLEHGNLKKANILLEKMIYTGIGDYFETIEIYISVLFQLQEYKKITTMLTMLLDEHQVPLQKINQYQELLELSKKLENDHDDHPSDIRIDFEHDDVKNIVQKLASLNSDEITCLFPNIIDFLKSESGNPLLKTILLNILKENDYNEEVVVKKFSRTLHLNVQNYAGVQEAPFPRKVNEKLEEKLAQENPSLLTYAIKLSEHFFFTIYPLEITFSDPDLWVMAIISIADGYMDQQANNYVEDNWIETGAYNSELQQAIEFIMKVEQQY